MEMQGWPVANLLSRNSGLACWKGMFMGGILYKGRVIGNWQRPGAYDSRHEAYCGRYHGYFGRRGFNRLYAYEVAPKSFPSHRFASPAACCDYYGRDAHSAALNSPS